MTAKHDEPSAAGDRCAACGSAFDCGAGKDSCWCAEIEISEETQADLASIYEGCLCRKCLTKKAGSEANDIVSLSSQE